MHQLRNYKVNSDKRNYQLLSLKKSHMSHHIIFISACAQNVFMQYKRKWMTLTVFANSTLSNWMTHAAHSLLMYHFSLSTYNFKIKTKQQIFNDFVVSVIFWADTCTAPYGFIVVNGQNTTSAFHKVV